MSFAEATAAASNVLAQTLGEQIEYLPVGGAAVPFAAPFKYTIEAVSFDAGVPVDVRVPRMLVRHEDMGAIPRQGDRFRIRGGIYVADQVSENSHGTSEVKLLKGVAQ